MDTQKNCPNCETPNSFYRRKCINEKCQYEFHDEDGKYNHDLEIPKRQCSICGVEFNPRLSNLKVSGNPYWIWTYNNYCGEVCFEASEDLLYKFVYNLIKSNQYPITAFGEISTNDLNRILDIVNDETYNFRKDDQNNTNLATYTQSLFPGSKRISANPKFEDFERVELLKKKNDLGKKPIEKNKEKIEKNVDEENLESDDYLDMILDKAEKEVENTNEEGGEEKKRKKPERKCAKCGGKTPGARTLKCSHCGTPFPSKAK